MTPYEAGFIGKCAEFGIDGRMMMKAAGSRYTVAKGDTLYGIASRNGVSASDLAKWNGLSDPGRLSVGQSLVLSPPGQAKPARPVPAPSPTTRPVVQKPPAAVRPAAKPAPPRLHRSPNGAVVSDSDFTSVNDFYNNIMLEKQKRHGGTPGVDYDDAFYRRDFPLGIPVESFTDAEDTAGGYVNAFDSNYRVHVNSDKPALARVLALVHELKHVQNGDSRFFSWLWTNRGISDRQKNLLKGSYGLVDSDVEGSWGGPVQESSTSNTEFQYLLWSDLSRKIGHPATYDEFSDFVKGMSRDDIRRTLPKIHSSYIDRMLRRRFNGSLKAIPDDTVEAIRDAWLRADNFSPSYSAGSAMNA